MVECAGLENQYTYMGIEGSNPSLSAKFYKLMNFTATDPHGQNSFLKQRVNGRCIGLGNRFALVRTKGSNSLRSAKSLNRGSRLPQK